MIRSGNEDNFASDADGDRGIFIVADGMGGHAAGEVASEMAVQIVMRELAGLRDLGDPNAA
ncbi:MAG: PP2C family protein-serine/threonine phosphatase, partial [Gemmatimonadaceae bacterium]